MLILNNGKEYFGKEFVEQFESILQSCKENDEFLFIHGKTTEDDAKHTCKFGLISDFPELYYTADLINSEDKLLYDKLKSWPHWECKFLVMCCVPKNSGKGGVPIWKKFYEDGVILLPEFIKGYIDVVKRTIVSNKMFSQKHQHEGMIEDRSYLPITGKMLEISIPPDEERFYEELLNPDK